MLRPSIVLVVATTVSGCANDECGVFHEEGDRCSVQGLQCGGGCHAPDNPYWICDGSKWHYEVLSCNPPAPDTGRYDALSDGDGAADALEAEGDATTGDATQDGDADEAG